MSRCQEAERWISLSLDGELSPARKKELEQHLAGCPRCRLALEEGRRETSVLRQALAPDPGSLGRIRRGLLDEVRALPAAQRRVVLTPFRVGAAAAALVLVALSFALWRDADPGPAVPPAPPAAEGPTGPSLFVGVTSRVDPVSVEGWPGGARVHRLSTVVRSRNAGPRERGGVELRLERTSPVQLVNYGNWH